MFENPHSLQPSNSLKSGRGIRGLAVFDIHLFLGQHLRGYNLLVRQAEASEKLTRGFAVPLLK